jgi:hypothetical protein
VPVLEKARYEKAEPNDEGTPPKQHANTLDGPIKSKIFVDFPHGFAPPN